MVVRYNIAVKRRVVLVPLKSKHSPFNIFQVTGREILIHFIDELVTGYGINETITSFLDETRIHILVTMNPDGFERGFDRIEDENEDCHLVYSRY